MFLSQQRGAITPGLPLAPPLNGTFPKCLPWRASDCEHLPYDQALNSFPVGDLSLHSGLMLASCLHSLFVLVTNLSVGLQVKEIQSL